MAWTVEYLPERDVVLLVVTGEILDEDSRAQVAETIRLLNEHQSTLVLVDCSDAVTKASLPGLYRLPDYATELGAPWNLRVAVVIPQDALPDRDVPASSSLSSGTRATMSTSSMIEKAPRSGSGDLTPLRTGAHLASASALSGRVTAILAAPAKRFNAPPRTPRPSGRRNRR